MTSASDFIKWLEVFGVPYGGGGGSAGKVNAGLANELAYYPEDGNSVNGLSTAPNGLLITNADGEPAITNSLLVNDDQSTPLAPLLVRTDGDITYPSGNASLILGTRQELNASSAANTSGTKTVTGDSLVFDYINQNALTLGSMNLIGRTLSMQVSSPSEFASATLSNTQFTWRGGNILSLTGYRALLETEGRDSTTSEITILAGISSQDRCSLSGGTSRVISGFQRSAFEATHNYFSSGNAISISDVISYDSEPIFVATSGTISIGSYYGLRLQAPTISGSTTITNRYGVFSGDDGALNYFAGDIVTDGDITASEANIGDLNIAGNVISTVADDDNIVLTPDGTGRVSISSDAIINGLPIGRGAAGLTNTFIIGGLGNAGITGLNNYTINAVNAFASLTTGANNISIGTNTLHNATEGRDNMCFGTNAGGGITLGSFNIGVGISACQVVTIGEANTAIGHGALSRIVESSRAVGIGRFTGRVNATGGADVSSAESAIFLGTNSTSSNATSPGTIALGAMAIVDPANGDTDDDDGAGIAIGSIDFPVGYRGDETVYPSAGASLGFWRVKLNGAYVRIELFADS